MGHEEVLQKLCGRVSYLTILIKQMAADLGELKINQLNTVNLESTAQEEPEDKFIYQFPISTLSFLDEFDQHLTNKEYYFKMVQFMAGIGGASPYEFVKRVMSRILTDEVAAQLSFTGHKGKKGVGEYFLIKALKDAAKKVKSLKRFTEWEMENFFKDWLRHAPARVKKLHGSGIQN